MQSGFAYIWEYRVKSNSMEEFRDLYGPDGGWVRLFRRAPGYLFTELLQDARDPQRFVSIDRWRSEAELAACQALFKSEWAALDSAGEAFTESELSMGSFSFSSSESG